MVGEPVDRHQFEDDMPNDSLPPFGDDSNPSGWDDALEGVEEAILSRVDGVDHVSHNYLGRSELSLICANY